MSNHTAIKNNIKPGDILLSRKINDPVSTVIAGVTKSNWSHAFLYIGNEKILESDWNGVVINPLSHYLNDRYAVGLFRIKPELTEEQADKIVKSARKKLGIQYGYLQLVWQFMLRLVGKNNDPDWSLDVDKGVICSELIAQVYEEQGIRIKHLPPHQIEPGDYDDSPLTVRIA